MWQAGVHSPDQNVYMICRRLPVLPANWQAASRALPACWRAQPLDTVRIRMQQPGCPWGSAGAGLRATVAREGPTALFRGGHIPAGHNQLSGVFPDKRSDQIAHLKHPCCDLLLAADASACMP